MWKYKANKQWSKYKANKQSKYKANKQIPVAKICKIQYKNNTTIKTSWIRNYRGLKLLKVHLLYKSLLKEIEEDSNSI